MSDFGDDRCGIGSSDDKVLLAGGRRVEVLDPALTLPAEFLAALRRARGRAERVVVVYPTRTWLEQRDLVLRLGLVALTQPRRSVCVHLHEFEHLPRPRRAALAVCLAVLGGRIVVSSTLEVEALRRRLGGLVARRAEIVIVPPANPSAPTAAELNAVGEVAEVAASTVGVHGQARPDKGIDWLLATLPRLGPAFTRLELAGQGWKDAPWPRSILRRYDIQPLGHLARADLPATFRRWGLAIAPFSAPPTDGRNSLRTPLAFGVPTLTRGPRRSGLRLDVDGLLVDGEVVVETVVPCVDAARRGRLAHQVHDFEHRVRAELERQLLG